jgi:hypothetical protein
MPDDKIIPIQSFSGELKQVTLQLRLEAVKEANKRARFAFLASTIASLAVLITVWNAYGSYYRFLPFLSDGAFASSEVTQWAQRELLSEWVKNQTISVGFLGIRVGVFDAALLGSISIFVISIWFFYSLRRANRTIGFLLRDTKDEKSEFRDMIYHGVVNSLIFVETGNGDYPVNDLDAPIPIKKAPFMRLAYQGLFFLPSLAILSIVIGDMLSLLVLNAPFRQGTPVLLHGIKYASASDWAKLIIMELTAVFLLYKTSEVCLKCLQFEKATGDILKQYHERLESQLSA